MSGLDEYHYELARSIKFQDYSRFLRQLDQVLTMNTDEIKGVDITIQARGDPEAIKMWDEYRSNHFQEAGKSTITAAELEAIGDEPLPHVAKVIDYINANSDLLDQEELDMLSDIVDLEDDEVMELSIEKFYRRLTPEDKLTIYELIDLDPSEAEVLVEREILLIRSFGPSNPTDDPHDIYSRMIGSYDDPDRSGFPGQCKKCGDVISTADNSVRMPIPGGGWRGCYCNWNCSMTSLSLDTKSLSQDTYTRFLVLIFQKQLQDYPLYRRI